MRLTRRADVADDLLQDLAVRLAGSSTFAGSISPYAFARRAALNLANDWRRKQQFRATAPLLVEPASLSSANVVDRNDEIEFVFRLLPTLGDRDQEMLVMRYLDDCTFEDIASQLGCTAHVARAMTHKALSNLRAAIGKKSSREVQR